jgi:hypothetical protein
MSDDEKTPDAADRDEDLSEQDLEYVSEQLADEATEGVVGGMYVEPELGFGEAALGEAG